MVGAVIKKADFFPAILGFGIASLVTYFVYEWRMPVPLEYLRREASHVTVKAGDIVSIKRTEERSRPCAAIVRRRLIAADNAITDFEPVRDSSQPADLDIESEFKFKVPPGLKSGPLIYRATYEFQCNIVQRAFGGPTVVFPDIVFHYTSFYFTKEN